MRVGWTLVACAVLTGCVLSPTAQNPRPSGTLEPTITESSAEPTARPKPSRACKLLSAEEREDLVRMSMDALVPVRPTGGTEECIWTHSLNEPARSAIRVIAVDGRRWAELARPQLVRAINHPATDKTLDRKLQKALVEVTTKPGDLTDERICEIYLLFTEARGMQRIDDLLLNGTIGTMPATYAASCGQGAVVLAGFGEYGMRSSIAINHAVTRLVDAASERVDELFSDAGRDNADEEDTPADEEATSDAEDDSPSPEPSPTETDGSDTSDGSDS